MNQLGQLKSLLLLGLIFSSHSQILALHKIVYFISPPRSLSTAFMRMMQERDDFAIFHEPSLNPFYQSGKVIRPVNITFTNDCAETTQKVAKRVLKQARTKNVFVKEISFSAELLLAENKKFVANKNVYFVFLVRNPHHSIISLYNKGNDIFVVPFPIYVGYEALNNCFKTVVAHAAHKPYLILAEDLYNNPEQTIQDFCTYLDIPYKPDALQWDDLGPTFDGREWHEVKPTKRMQHWHGEAIKSTGFDKPRQYKIKNGVPSFEEITDITHRSCAEAAYYENLKHYDELLKAFSRLK